MHYDVIILAVIFISALWIMHRNARKKIRVNRRRTFDRCESLFANVDIVQDDVNFPVLSGHYKNLEIKIEPLVDHIVVRKIPSLWLLITVKTSLPFTGALDFLVRPQNTEFYSPSASFHTLLDIPKDWPQHASLRTNDVDNIPSIEIVGRHIQKMFEDEKTKELLITPNGIRVVYQADQALRSHYMVLRQLIFENFQLDPILVKQLLDAMFDLLNDLSGSYKPAIAKAEEK